MKGLIKKISVNSSIKRFLIISILSFTTLYLVAIYFISTHKARHEIEELFDAQLAQSSYILLNLLGDSVSTIDQNSKHLPVVYHGLNESRVQDKNALLYEKKVAYQIWNGKGKLLIKSGSAPLTHLSKNKEGYSRIEVKNNDGSSEMWRVFSLYDDDWDFWLHAAESVSIREELARDISRHTLKPGVIILPFVLLSLLFIIRFGLHPLKQLTQNIRTREVNNLSAIELAHTPVEMKPVVDSLNELFSRLEDAIKREQRLTADAAHELRTPLSVIMIHAQNAIKSDDESVRDLALHELEIGVKRASRLLEQLLTLSKISPDTIPVETLKFYPLCQEAVAQMAPKVMAKDQEISLQCDTSLERITLNASAFLLEILIRNLIDNASEYTPKQGQIELLISVVKGKLTLVVQDSGSGVSQENLGKLTDRFFREHQQTGSGAGLGLALVNSIVTFHGGALEFGPSPLGGLKVQASFPL
ncbi:MAG: ATP-binding protein [Bermanella sp.]